MTSGTGEVGNNFKIRRIGSEDLPHILTFVRENFVPDEILNNLLGSGDSEDRMCDIDAVVISSVNEGLCLMAMQTESNKIAGVVIMNVNSDKKSNVHSFVPRSSITQLVRKALSLDFNVFAHFGVSAYAHISITVGKEFRHSGLGSELLKESINKCTESKVPVISGLCTGPTSQALALKFGFQEEKRKYYVELLETNPTVNFTRKPSPHEFMSQMVLKLDLD